ncbi:glycosyltransferase [Vibrio vulnificus]|uniref:glycosyltransferase n=1 Tax=Vibrio vulnificus TaxID=672 RepID=UPI004058FBDC
MKVILVNATSLTSGGALSILNQFILHSDDKFYHMLISSDAKINESTINHSKMKIWRVNPQSSISRVFWDFYGLRCFAIKNSINYDTVVSLQNTTVRVGNKQQVVYLHQGIPLHSKKWSFFKSSERKYAFYKYIYPIFIFMNRDENTKFVVQTEWMKKSLIEKFNIPKSNVYNIKPDFIRWELGKYKVDRPKNDYFYLFYPATGELFKNHSLILCALRCLYEMGHEIKNIRVIFTFNEGEYEHIDGFLLKNPEIRECVIFSGKLSYDEVLFYYENSDLILFPSEIESFGLPLLEAAYSGRKIISLPTEFSKEIICNYDGVEFVDGEPKIWATKIRDCIRNSDTQYASYAPLFNNNWNTFFQLL